MTSTATPAEVGDRIRATFRSPFDGATEVVYVGTVEHIDSRGVDLIDADTWDDDFRTWASVAQVGVAWPRNGTVHVYQPHRADCPCSACHDFS